MNTSSCSESTYGQLSQWVGGWWFVPHDLQLYFLFVIKREVRVCLDQVPVPEWWSELAPRGELSVGISDRGCQEITSEWGSGYPRRRGNRNTVQWRWLTLHNYIVSYTQKLYTMQMTHKLRYAPRYAHICWYTITKLLIILQHLWKHTTFTEVREILTIKIIFMLNLSMYRCCNCKLSIISHPVGGENNCAILNVHVQVL